MSGWRQVGDLSADTDRPCSHFRRSGGRRLACLSSILTPYEGEGGRPDCSIAVLATRVVIFRPAWPCDVRYARGDRLFTAPTLPPLLPFSLLRSVALHSGRHLHVDMSSALDLYPHVFRAPKRSSSNIFFRFRPIWVRSYLDILAAIGVLAYIV